ncbi:MAG: hypothetical protein QM617_04010 [Comamonas sp.]
MTMLKQLFGLASRYEKQTRHYLDTARIAALEHEIAAEHHAALARMYREREARLAELVEAVERKPVTSVAVEPRMTVVG